jgi:hypothetical protein
VGAGSLWPWLPFLSPRTQKSVRLHILDDHIYQNAFSALVIINRFLEMPIFKKIICLKCQKIRKLQGKITKKWWKPKSQSTIAKHVSNN